MKSRNHKTKSNARMCSKIVSQFSQLYLLQVPGQSETTQTHDIYFIATITLAKPMMNRISQVVLLENEEQKLSSVL